MKHVKTIAFCATISLVLGCAVENHKPDPMRASLNPRAIFNAEEKAPLAERVESATEVYSALIAADDQQIPAELIKSAKCVAIVPNLIKAAFLVGARYGEGIVSCRDVFGNWSPSSFITLTGGSFGWQIGAQSTDLVLFFMDRKSARSLLERNLTLGGDISIAAGPIGRTAGLGTDMKLQGVYSYARSEGFFAGVSLEGAVIVPDDKANAIYYDEVVSPRDLLFNSAISYIPEETKEFIDVLSRES